MRRARAQPGPLVLTALAGIPGPQEPLALADPLGLRAIPGRLVRILPLRALRALREPPALRGQEEPLAIPVPPERADLLARRGPRVPLEAQEPRVQLAPSRPSPVPRAPGEPLALRAPLETPDPRVRHLA